MKRNLVWLLLALSVLFNVFFMAGYVQARAAARRAAEAEVLSQRVARELALDEGQQAVFAALRSALREETVAYDGEMALLRQELAAELARQEPDLARVRELVSRGARLEQGRHEARARRFSEFLGTLNPEQCRRLGHRLGPEGRRGGGVPPWVLEEFDADRDGALSETERAEAGRFLEARRQEREKKRAELLQRFDRDGDGRLNEQEREALRRWREAQPDAPPHGDRVRGADRHRPPNRPAGPDRPRASDRDEAAGGPGPRGPFGPPRPGEPAPGQPAQDESSSGRPATDKPPPDGGES
jgi:hypothetical protein